MPENPEIKATAVFRSQLMNPQAAGNSAHLALPEDLARLKPEQVQVVAKEPRVSSALFDVIVQSNSFIIRVY